MEKEINISAVQMCSKLGDKKANYTKVYELIKRDVERDVDIIVLPEVWTVGWSCKRFQESAEEINNSQTLEFLSFIAKEYDSFVIGGSFIEKRDGKYYNTCPVINRAGKLIATYSKIHLFSYYDNNEGKYISEGDNPVMVEIDGVKVGLTICYDIRFPEIFRAYRKAGADILVTVAAWGSLKPIPWEIMPRSRAIENQTYMVALTQSGQIEGDDWNIGHSRIIDYKGEVLSEIKYQKEGAVSSIINLNEMYEFRDKCTILNDIKQTYEVKMYE